MTWTLPLLYALLAAGASSPGVRSYQVAPGITGCPSPTEFWEQVDQRVSPGHTSAASAHLALTVSVHRNAQGRLVGSVAAEEPGQTGRRRELDPGSEDCQELARALALATSLALDPLAALEGPGPVSGVSWSAGLALAGGWGLVPGVPIGLRASSAWRWRELSVGAEVGADWPFTVPTLQALGVPVAAGLTACLHLGGLSPCLLASGGPVFFPSATLGQTAWVAAAGTRLGWEQQLFGRLWWQAAVDLQLPLLRMRLVDREQEVWRGSLLSVSARVGLLFGFQ